MRKSRFYNPSPDSLARPRASPQRYSATNLLKPLPGVGDLNATGSPVRLIGGLGRAIRDPLPVGEIDAYSSGARAIELARAAAAMFD